MPKVSMYTLKGTVNPKKGFIHLHVIPTLFDFFFGQNTKDILKNVGKQTVLVPIDILCVSRLEPLGTG